MKAVSRNVRLVRGAYWLIRLRWIALGCVAFGTFICSSVLDISLHHEGLYAITVLLAVYNSAVLTVLNRLTRKIEKASVAAVTKIIKFQMAADLLILTALLHYAGGIENPFVFFYIFHTTLASILLSVRESNLQATFAILLYGVLILLEYLGLIPHHCLEGYVPECLHRDGLYILGTFFVFGVTLYMVVYMAGSVAMRVKRAEQAQNDANKLLRQKDRIKDEYVLRVTHDIKGHLSTIRSCLDVLVNRIAGELNERQEDFANRAHRRTIKLTKFVRALLTLTQMRLSDKLQMEDFSLQTTMDSALAGVQTKAEEESITLKCDMGPSVGTVFGNQFSIEEMITNLLLNAIKYTLENGTVCIKATNHDDFIQTEIADTGIGIPRDELPNVFDEFYRATNAREVEHDGTGLGLSIAKHIIERHGGKIWVESKEGHGATFKFTIPKGPQ
jgi:signal transduction histidine kinase